MGRCRMRRDGGLCCARAGRVWPRLPNWWQGAEVKVADRAAAEKLTNTRLYVERERLPEPEPDEFYLADLVGLAACDAAGAGFGTVTAVHDYGAGVSLEIGREGAPPLLVPFTRAAVPEVDVARGRVVVAPPEELDAVNDSSPPLEEGGSGMGDPAVGDGVGRQPSGHFRPHGKGDDVVRLTPAMTM